MRMHNLIEQIQISFRFLVIMSLILGVMYPAIVTIILQLGFHHRANGSILFHQHQAIGSELIGQYFDAPHYFLGRPSATHPFPYNAAHSEGSNLSPNNPLLLSSIHDRMSIIKIDMSSTHIKIPNDLVFSSASGLDPHISLAAAYFQMNRVANHRHIRPEKLKKLIDYMAIKRQWNILGEPCINVLMLNLAVDNKEYDTI